LLTKDRYSHPARLKVSTSKLINSFLVPAWVFGFTSRVRLVLTDIIMIALLIAILVVGARDRTNSSVEGIEIALLAIFFFFMLFGVFYLSTRQIDWRYRINQIEVPVEEDDQEALQAAAEKEADAEEYPKQCSQ
jgi:hypothetical protein